MLSPILPILALLIGPVGAERVPEAVPAANAMAFPGKDWAGASPESQGVDPAKFREAVDYLGRSLGEHGGAGTLFVVRNGYAIWAGPECDRQYQIYSATKSFTSTLLGLLVEDGKVSLETLAKDIDPALAKHYPAVTLRHFATMTSGYDSAGGAYEFDGQGRGDSWNPGPPAVPLFPPGTKFRYWDDAMMQFGSLLTKAARQPLDRLFKRRIAEPIGMTQWRWTENDSPVGRVLCWTGGIHTSSRELARFGHLFLNRGTWNSRQLIRPAWVAQATAVQVPASIPNDALPRSRGAGIYGYNWWVNGVKPDGQRLWPGAPPGTFYANGLHANVCIVVPEWAMVIARTNPGRKDGSRNSPPNIDEIWNAFFARLSLAVAPAAGDRPASTFHPSRSLPQAGPTSPELAPLDELMRTFVLGQDVPGAALAVARRGRLLYARGFGYADVDRAVAVQPDSLFRIASVSKPITAIAILRLVDQGKLKTSDRVLDLLKAKLGGKAADPVDSRWRELTVLQLLQHTGGFDRDRSGDPMFRSVAIAAELGLPPPAPPEAIIRSMLRRRLDFDPGTRYAYSNFGYCLLGRVVDAVSGRPYEAFVRDEILKPVGITRMQIGATAETGRAAGEVRYCTRSDRRTPSVLTRQPAASVPVQYGGWYLEAMDAHGGWIASAVDLVRLASALDEDSPQRLLSASALRALFAPPPAPAWREPSGELAAAYYACGWLVRPVGSGGQANTWHTGLLAGTSTLLVRRHDGFVWAVLFNCDQARDGKTPAALIDGPIHQAVDRVRHWPERPPSATLNKP